MHAYVCERERDSTRGREREKEKEVACMCVCIRICVVQYVWVGGGGACVLGVYTYVAMSRRMCTGHICLAADDEQTWGWELCRAAYQEHVFP